ncbi:MAG TPA: carboxymuconolactone decarboxylase family protein [Pirellulales bacterium]|nr:carboxymuconolactone decarboxylase family protein [Pirellulales bacterium]
MSRFIPCLSVFMTCLFAHLAIAADSSDAPRPIPLTRPEMKHLLEDMKGRTPRIPLPELTDEEKARLGERGTGYEGRLRTLYMPTSDGRNSFGGFFGRDNNGEMTLDYRFKTMLFWIVSRTNNCQYCLGHQESKLLAAGMTEDEIASLDGDWLQFSPAERAAFALARKLTFEPHKIADADIDALRPYYSDLQILEMVVSVSGNNAINRWKEGAGVPQSKNGGAFGRREAGATAAQAPAVEHSYLTPTSEPFKNLVTKVAPLAYDDQGATPTRQTVCRRPPLEPRDEVERALTSAERRKPRLPLVDESKARELLNDQPTADTAGQRPLPQWERLLASFPTAGKAMVLAWRSADEKGDLTPLLKAQVSWIIARQDRAWYATGEARSRLRSLGCSDEQIYSLDGDWEKFAPADQALFNVARKLAATPVVLTDADVAKALELTGPRLVVQLISYVTQRASFDRITEAAGLALDP